MRTFSKNGVFSPECSEFRVRLHSAGARFFTRSFYFLDTYMVPFSILSDRLWRSASCVAAVRHGVQPNFIGSD